MRAAFSGTLRGSIMRQQFRRLLIAGFVFSLLGAGAANAGTFTIDLGQPTVSSTKCVQWNRMGMCVNSQVVESPAGFEHGTDYLYTEPADAIRLASDEILTSVTITLDDFYNWANESGNFINVGLAYDGLVAGKANKWVTSSDFSKAGVSSYGLATFSGLGTSARDYSVTITDATYLTEMTSGLWGILLDPNCHYYGTVEVSYTTASKTPPVPEPASMLLLGTGLVGAGAAVRRRRRQ
jgi:hypothetical protein